MEDARQATCPELEHASDAAIRAALHDLIPQFRANRWLDPENPYSTGTAKAVSSLRKKGRISRPRLNEYIAVSAVLHCFDGWAFLGRGLAADILGDSSSARHFAYYAELRAAMAILASQGVGVFRRTHIVVDEDGASTPITLRKSGGTHDFAPLALRHWAKTGGPGVLSRIVAPAGVGLFEWLALFDSSPGAQQLFATHIVKQWGLDLHLFGLDRDARNEASYRPNTISSTSVSSATKSLDFAVALWRLCEPGYRSAFRTFDRHLLLHSIATLFKHRSDESIAQASPEYGNQVERMLNGLPISSDERADYRRFLIPGTGLTDLIENARRTPDSTAVGPSVPILSRATLLLHLATGCARDLLTSIPDFREYLRFWWEEVGGNRTLWILDSPPEACSDLWSDAAEALDGVNEFMADPSSNSRSVFWRDYATEVAVLGTTERIGLWGLGL